MDVKFYHNHLIWNEIKWLYFYHYKLKTQNLSEGSYLIEHTDGHFKQLIDKKLIPSKTVAESEIFDINCSI